eukprot:COSAG02_NODE_201_length_29473_cov_135.510213_13_plen_65_part_00
MAGLSVAVWVAGDIGGVVGGACSVCAVSTARPEESRGSDCGTGRGLAYSHDRGRSSGVGSTYTH